MAYASYRGNLDRQVDDWSTEFDAALLAKSVSFFGEQVQRHVNRLPGPDPIDWLRDTLNTSLQRHRWVLGVDHTPVRLWCDFVDHNGINACAFQHEELFTIAIHRPAVAGLQQIFSEILRRSEIYPEAGPREEPKPLSADTPISIPPAPDSDETEKANAVEAGVPTSMPASPQRFQFATFVHRLALDLLYFHELHHVLLGHVGYLQNRFGPCAIFEVPQSHDIPIKDRVPRKTIEFTADFMAGASIADCLASHSFAMAGRVEVVEDPEGQLARDSKLAELILFASGVLFSTLESQLVSQGLQDTPGYPISETRWFSVLRGMERRLGGIGHPLVDLLYDKALPDALRSIHLAMSQTGFKDPLFDTIFQSKHRRHEAVDDLASMESNLFEMIEQTKSCAVQADDLCTEDLLGPESVSTDTLDSLDNLGT